MPCGASSKSARYEVRSLLACAVPCCLLLVTGAVKAQDRNKDLSILEQLNNSFEAVTEQASPAVVRIFTTGFGAAPGQDPVATGIVATRRQGGSGVLVHPEGYLVTNAHIVAGAQEIRVMRIPSGEGAMVEGSIIRPAGGLYEARLVGYDLETDIAVLKIETRVLRYLRFGDSDNLRKGQIVFAFGNPRGLEDSVSMGVVSSAARQLEPEAPMIYIQTDASIKPGNDGGPLVNIEGQIVGINNYAVSEETASQGFGFAAPSNIVRAIYEQIRRTGRVRRGVLGVLAQTITPFMAQALELPREKGVIVSDVLPGSPADFAGLGTGDIILRLDGKDMENARQFNVNVYRRRLGDRVALDVLREGVTLTLEARVAERTDDPARFSGMVDPSRNLVPKLGILALDLTEELLEMLPILRAEQGVLVAGLPAGFQQVYEFQPGDVIHAINGKPLANLDELRADLARRKKGDIVVLQLERNARLRYATVGLE